MISFFRSLRATLFFKGKTSQYLRYAIGEIALVMIGILLALQVNTWNENRITQLKINNYLIALSTETDNNKERLQRALQRTKTHMEDYVLVLKDLNSDTLEITNEYMNTTRIKPFFKTELERSVFDDIISSGILESLKDQELKKEIFKLDVLFRDYDSGHETANDVWKEYILPYFNKHLNISNLWDSLYVIKMPKLKFKNNLSAFVHNKEFANMIASQMRMYTNFIRDIDNGMATLDRLSIKLHENIKPQ